MYEVPLSEKYSLSITEAAKYFRIGERKLYQLIADSPNEKWFFMNGNRYQIKRRLFEEYMDEATAI